MMGKDAHMEVSFGHNRAAAYLVPLRAAGDVGPGRVGAKAARLGELQRVGFPVPPGVVLVSDALARFLKANGLGPATSPDEVLRAHFPGDLLRAVACAAAALGAGPLAVRSSGASEDSKDASFAGLFESVLGVEGLPALIGAVRRCWASAFSPRFAAYRTAHGGVDAPFAVLIQRQVRARAAGVTFTANPVTGDRDEAIVNAVRGLGERLVSGETTPDEWVVRNGRATCRRAPEDAIDEETALAVVDVARAIERHFGSPQDVEWAVEDGRIAVIQARPITALPPPALRVIPPQGYWTREPSHYPRPLFPMTRSVYLPAVNAGFRSTFAMLGVLPETLELREIGGWVYKRLVPPGGKDRRPPPRWFMTLAIRTVPALRRRVHRAVDAVRSNLHARLIARWHAEWKPEFDTRIEELVRMDLKAATDPELAAHFRETKALIDRGTEIHMNLHGALCLALGALVFACRDLLGWDDAAALELLTGLSLTSTEAARALADAAATIRANPEARALLEGAGEETATLEHPVIREALSSYARRYGMQVLRYEVADPTLSESPQLLLRLLRGQLSRAYDSASDDAALECRREQALACARDGLRRRSSADRDRFEHILAQARRAYPVREENEFFTQSEPLALNRRAALEIGRRLAGRGQLGEPGDVFFLEFDEACGALIDEAPVHTIVERRRAEREAAIAHPAPQAYGRNTDGPPPLDALPPEARFANEALQWAVDRILGPGGLAQAHGDRLRGVAASPGEYVGTVCVVRFEEELCKLRPGDVLVCPITSPVWSVVFPSVGALVTDEGGILSHPAIIAREYRIPAVVATGCATRELHDGQQVRVDGTRGEVAAA